MIKRRRDEGGAVAVLVGISMSFVLLVVAAFVVDLGSQRVARRDMQSLADLVALDLSRLLDGRTKAEIEGDPAWLQTREDAEKQNDDYVLGEDLDVDALLGDYVLDAARCSSSGRPQSPCFIALTAGQGGEVPTAVQVTAGAVVSFAFVPGEGPVKRTAVAANQKTACFALGSYAAAINTKDASLLGPLNSLLGLNLTALSYQGLAAATISIDDLVATGNVGTAEQLLSGNVSLGQLYTATLEALGNQQRDTAGLDNTVAIDGLNALIDAHVNQSQPVSIANVVSIDPNDTAALATQFNLLDLLVGSALIANGSNAVALTDLTAGNASIGAVTVNTLKVIERASRACGTVDLAPTMAACQTSPMPPAGCARNSQVQGSATIPLLGLPAVGGFVVATSNTVLTLNLGNAAGRLVADEPTCAKGTVAAPDKLNVQVATSAATSSLTTSFHLEQQIEVPVIKLVPPSTTTYRVVIEFDATTSALVPSSTGTADVPLSTPPNDLSPAGGNSKTALGVPGALTMTNLRVSVDNDGDGVGDVAVSTLGAVIETAINLVVNPIVNTALSATNTIAINGVIGALVTSINSTVAGPLAKLLGLDVAGADVYAVGRPTCQTPKLVG